MKILFFSDVHGSSGSMEQLFDWVKLEKPDQTVLLGDVLYHGPRNPLRNDYAPPRVIELLNSLKNSIVAVRGNCDAEVDQMMLDFPIMVDYSTILAGAQRFFLTHGHLWSPENLPLLPPGSIFASGHTHIPLLKFLNDKNITLFNPGSISLPKGGFPATFGIFDNGVLSVRNLESGETILS